MIVPVWTLCLMYRYTASVFGVCGCARVSPVVGSSPSCWVVKCHGPPEHPLCSVAIAEGRPAHVIKPDGATPVCYRITLHVDGGPAHCVWPGALPFGSSGRRCAGTPRPSGRQHRWQRWDFGVPRLPQSVSGRILRTMTKTSQVVPGVIRCRPVRG